MNDFFWMRAEETHVTWRQGPELNSTMFSFPLPCWIAMPQMLTASWAWIPMGGWQKHSPRWPRKETVTGWMFAPQIPLLKPEFPKWWYLRWGLWEVMKLRWGHEGEGHYDEISALTRRDTRELSSFLKTSFKLFILYRNVGMDNIVIAFPWWSSG